MFEILFCFLKFFSFRCGICSLFPGIWVWLESLWPIECETDIMPVLGRTLKKTFATIPEFFWAWDRYYRKILSPPGERANSRDKGSLKGAHLSNYRYNETLGVDWTSLTILTILVLNKYPLTLIATTVNATGKLPVQPCQSHNPQIMRTNKQSCYIRCYFSLVYRNIMKCDFQMITFT